MKKVFGIMLALALVLSMTVMASPVSATLTPGWVALSNDLANQPSDYMIRFYTEEPLVTLHNDVINIQFPAGTDITAVVLGDITVNTNAITAVTIVAQSLVIEVGTDVPAGTVTVDITNLHIINPAPCYHYLSVGTSHETTVDIGPYKIYLLSLPLLAGWNLVSLPGIPEDPAIGAVLADLFAQAALDPTFSFKVYYYETATATWFIYASDTSFSSLTTIEDGKSYWIWASYAFDFRVKGVWYPPPPGPPLKYCYVPCWNMVGFTSGSLIVTAAVYFANHYPDYLYTWDGTAWITVLPGDLMIPGRGYWASFLTPGCVVPPTP